MALKINDTVETNANWNRGQTFRGVVTALTSAHATVLWPNGLGYTHPKWDAADGYYVDPGQTDTWPLHDDGHDALDVVKTSKTISVNTVNCAELRDHAVRGAVEVGKIYLYVYPHLNAITVIKATSVIQYLSPKERGMSEHQTEKKMGFYAANDTGAQRWHYAGDSGVIPDQRQGGNFLLDPVDLFDKGILVDCKDGVIVPEGAELALALILPA
jgi:hypothetical protein